MAVKLGLTPDCHEQIEAEANFTAGRLLFLQDIFTDNVLSIKPGISAIKQLHKRFGNTLSTTFYRYIEAMGENMPVVGIISKHPNPREIKILSGEKPVKYYIRSLGFSKKFAKITEDDLFLIASKYCGQQQGGMLGDSEIIVLDDNGNKHRFFFETFYNRYDALTLGIYLAPEVTMIVMNRG